MRIIITLFLLFTYQTAFADTLIQKKHLNEKQCDECPSTNTKDFNTWHLLTSNTSGGSFSHIIDNKTYNVITYDFSSLGDNQLSQETLHNLISPTPASIANTVNILKTEFTQIEELLTQATIPQETLNNAWKIINCGFCKGNIEDYIKKESLIKSSLLRIENTLSDNDIIAAKLDNNYTINIENGGFIAFQISTINFIEIDIKFVSATDSNGNSIPEHHNSLIDQEFKTGNGINPEFINALVNTFNLYFEVTDDFSGVIKEKK